jgi:hypothetical protein
MVGRPHAGRQRRLIGARGRRRRGVDGRSTRFHRRGVRSKPCGCLDGDGLSIDRYVHGRRRIATSCVG